MICLENLTECFVNVITPMNLPRPHISRISHLKPRPKHSIKLFFTYFIFYNSKYNMSTLLNILVI